MKILGKMQPHATDTSNLVRAGQCRSTAISAPNARWRMIVAACCQWATRETHTNAKRPGRTAKAIDLVSQAALLAHATEVIE